MMEASGNIYHLIFQTRDFGVAIPPLHRDEFFDAIALLFSNRHCPVYAVGGDMNHVHILTEIPFRKNVKMLIEKIKNISCFRAAGILDMERFGGWLKGCLSFIVERDRLPFWADYIEQQDTIHSEISWMQEKRQFMNYNLF
ncbi:transposase [uncultured Duncaniella sp.]|uniref:transposase n=1 Tax=uncultured Duncaniella sp. TaxID=2768039 RepID=UPI0025A9D276|nr:transposase [uncultured Duncaniella sp.]